MLRPFTATRGSLTNLTARRDLPPPIRRLLEELSASLRKIPHHLVTALRLNLIAVLPVTLLLVFLGDRNWHRLEPMLLLVFILTNSNFLVLDAFYHSVWKSLRRRLPMAYLALVLVILPVLGAAGGLLGMVVFDWIAPGSLRISMAALMEVNILMAALFGLGLFIVEDLRGREREMIGELKSSRIKQDELEVARDEAEIRRLQALLKPHFVFNTLNTIAALLPEDPLAAQQMTLRLAKLLRYVLETEGEAMVSLESEVHIVLAYLEIEKVRMGDRLEYQIDIPKALLTVPMPGLLLQPLVENAVKHGVRSHGGPGYVRLRARADDRDCQIEVADNGSGFSADQGLGQGLRLVRSRLERVYGERCELKLERDTKAGETVAILRFSLRPRG